MKLLILTCAYLFSCGSPHASHKSLQDEKYILGLVPISLAQGKVEPSFELVLCPVSNVGYSEEYLQKQCVPALKTHQNKRVLFTEVPDASAIGWFSRWLTKRELHAKWDNIFNMEADFGTADTSKDLLSLLEQLADVLELRVSRQAQQLSNS